MKTSTVLGVLLIVVAFAAFAYEGFTYTSSEEILDIGPLTVTTEETRTLTILPILGGAALVGGVALLLVTGRKQS